MQTIWMSEEPWPLVRTGVDSELYSSYEVVVAINYSDELAW